MPNDVEKRIADLQQQIDELKAQLEPKEEFIPDPDLSDRLRNFDPLANVRLPASASKAMAQVVGDPPKGKFDLDAWRRNSPGELRPLREFKGVSTKAAPIKPEEEYQPPKPNWSGWSK